MSSGGPGVVCLGAGVRSRAGRKEEEEKGDVPCTPLHCYSCAVALWGE